MKTILLVAPADKPHLTSFYIKRALEKLRCNVIIYDYRMIFNRFFKSETALAEHIVSIVNEVKPDLVLVLKGEVITPEAIKNIKPLKVLWYFDVQRCPSKWLIDIADKYDYFFTICNDEKWFKFFKDANVKFLPEAYDHYVIKPTKVSNEEKEKYGSTIAFVGTDNHSHRARILYSLAIIYRINDLKIWGNQVNGYWNEYMLNTFWQGYRTSDYEFNKICASTKILLGFTNCVEEDYNTCFSARVYQTLGAKGFLIEEKSKGIEKMFKIAEPGVTGHLVTWNNRKDLKYKIKYYLEHEDERMEIARLGYNFVRRKHTFRERMKQMFKIIGL